MSEKTTTIDPKPFYAVAGVADAAISALRDLSANAPVVAERAENLTAQARERVADLPADFQRLRSALPADVRRLRAELPEDVRKLRAELPDDVQKLRAELPAFVQEMQAKVMKYASELAHDLSGTYDELAVRGEQAVGRFRRAQADTIDAVTGKVADAADKAADAADKAADAADKVADEIADAPAAKPRTRPAR